MDKKRKDKMVIVGLSGGGLINSILMWHRSGTPERLIEIQHSVTEAWSRNRHNPCNKSEPCLIRPLKWNINKIIDN